MNNNRLRISEPNLLFLYANRPVILCDSVMQIMRVCILATLPFRRRRDARARSRLARVSRRDPRPRRQCRFRRDAEIRMADGSIDWSTRPSILVAVISSPYFYSVRFRSFVEGFRGIGGRNSFL